MWEIRGILRKVSYGQEQVEKQRLRSYEFLKLRFWFLDMDHGKQVFLHLSSKIYLIVQMFVRPVETHLKFPTSSSPTCTFQDTSLLSPIYHSILVESLVTFIFLFSYFTFLRGGSSQNDIRKKKMWQFNFLYFKFNKSVRSCKRSYFYFLKITEYL